MIAIGKALLLSFVISTNFLCILCEAKIELGFRSKDQHDTVRGNRFSRLTFRRPFCVPDQDELLFKTEWILFFRAPFYRLRFGADKEGVCTEDKCPTLCERFPCKVSHLFLDETESCVCLGNSASTPVQCFDPNAECLEVFGECVCKEGFAGDALLGCQARAFQAQAFRSNAELRAAVEDYLGGDTFASSLYGPLIREWNVSLVDDFTSVFEYQEISNDKIPDDSLDTWDVSRATSMHRMFVSAGGGICRQSLASWDVSKVTDMSEMFSFSICQVSGLSGWNVSSLKSATLMFAYGSVGDGDDLSAWDVSAVTDMSYMFIGGNPSNLSAWDVSAVTDMQWMFFSSTISMVDISGWNVSSVTDLNHMFYYASRFNNSLCNWGPKLNPGANVENMFNLSGCLEIAAPDLSLTVPGPFCHPCN